MRVSTSCLRLRLTETAQQRRSLSQLAVEGDKEDASHFIVHTPEIADHGLSTGGREAGGQSDRLIQSLPFGFAPWQQLRATSEFSSLKT